MGPGVAGLQLKLESQLLNKNMFTVQNILVCLPCNIVTEYIFQEPTFNFEPNLFWRDFD